MSPLHERDNDNIGLYPSGVRVSVFMADDSGSIYYPSGKVAINKGMVEGRFQLYIYGNDARSTPLGALNEHAVGFFLGSRGVRLVLNKVGGLLTDEHGKIVREWRYHPRARMPPPAEDLELRLNESITLSFRDQSHMWIKFLHGGISRELDVGVRPKRQGSYLDHSIRLPGGKFEPQLNRKSLISRQQSFGDNIKAKRDLLKPRSQNLAGVCKALVSDLENSFDGLAPKVKPFSDPSWKECAHGATRKELPRIRSTGLEVGPTHGLGTTIYGDYDRQDSSPGLQRSISWAGGATGERCTENGERSGDAFSPTARLKKGGKWLGELDVQRKLSEENPLLKRSKILRMSSGRYTNEISVLGRTTSVKSLTGKAVVTGVRLRSIPASRLEPFLEEETGPEQLVAVLCVRQGSLMCNKMKVIAELANQILLQRSGLTNADGGVTRFPASFSGSVASENSRSIERDQIVKVDFGEHPRLADLYGVKSVPAFLMFRGRRLIWAGTLGGNPVKAAPPETAATRSRVLLVEPSARDQITTERAMRRFGCNWDLTLSASQAILRIQFARANAMASEIGEDDGEGYSVLAISDALGAAEVFALEKAFYSGSQRKKDELLVVGLAALKGDVAEMSKSARQVVSVGFTESENGKRAVLSGHLALVADIAVTKPLRSTALEAAFQCLARRTTAASDTSVGEGGRVSIRPSCGELGGGDRRYKGATPLRLVEKMEALKAQARKGVLTRSVLDSKERRLRPEGALAEKSEILVTAQETEYRGYTLNSSTLRHLIGQ